MLGLSFPSKLNWDSYMPLLIKLFWRLFLHRLSCISTNLPSSLAGNVAISVLVLLINTWTCWISYRNESVEQNVYRIHTKHGWAATTRHGVTTKRRRKRLEAYNKANLTLNLKSPRSQKGIWTSGPSMRIRKWKQFSHFKWTSIKVIPIEKT